MRKHLFLLLLTLTLGQAIKAQDKLTVYGAGRFSMHSGGVSGDVYDGLVIGADTLSPDTVSARSEMAGYALFDLGFQFRPNAQTEIKALTRVYSELDGFWGQGINFNFRELYVRGIVKGKVKYRVGDLDLKMSKFTLYNSNGDLGAHDNNATHLYEDIIQYENFFRNNSWRQQGLQTSFKLKLPGNGNRLDVMAFLAKNRQADYFFTPDRLLGGGMLSYEKLGWGKLDYYRTELFEIAETAPFSGQAQRISTQSIAGTVKNPKLGRYVYHFEAGLSNMHYIEFEPEPSTETGAFFQLGLREMAKEKKLHYFANFNYVESQFRSPGAQSRRNNFAAAPTQFSFQGNQENVRQQTVFDVLTDPTAYFRTIDPILGAFNPAYSNVQPYGEATPNRTGLQAGFRMNQDSSWVEKLDAHLWLMSEVNGEGTDKRRSFMRADVSTTLNFAGLLQTDKALLLEAYLKYENTGRDPIDSELSAIAGIGQVDLSSVFLELTIAKEISDDLFIHAGMYLLQASGNEYMAVRNEFNQITDYTEMDIDLTDRTLLAGIKYSLNQNNHLLIQVRNSNITNEQIIGKSYSINQALITYNLFF